MAVAEPGMELAGAFRWGLSLAGTYVARVFVFGLLAIALSAPALHLTPIAFPQSTPFLWLAIVGLVLGLLEPNPAGENGNLLGEMTERSREKTRRERFIYLVSFAMLGIVGFSFLTAVVGTASALVARELGVGLLAVAVALWYPAVDAWLGRVVGWNVASVGGLIALLLLWILALLYQVSPEVPRSAARDVRRNLIAH